jgi:hypothetical protein
MRSELYPDPSLSTSQRYDSRRRVTSGIMAPRCVREAELTVFSYVLARHREFVIHGLETCYLNAVSRVDPQNLKMSLYHPEI